MRFKVVIYATKQFFCNNSKINILVLSFKLQSGFYYEPSGPFGPVTTHVHFSKYSTRKIVNLSTLTYLKKKK